MGQDQKLLDLILKQLEALNEKQEKLSNEIGDTSYELTRLSGIKHVVSDIKKWKEDIEQYVNLEDLREMKDAIEDYNKFKTRILTVVSVVGFIVGIAISIIVAYIEHSK